MDRRTFLATLGASLMAPRWARAQSARTARRLVVLFSPNGTVHRHWRPTGQGTSFSFPAGSILEPLAAHRSQLVVLDGLDFVGASNHEGGMAAMLTGRGHAGTVGAGASVDQHIARQIGAGSRFPSLELSAHTTAWGGGTQTRMCYSGPGAFVTPSDDPREVHRRLFGEAAAGMGDARAARRRSILDLARAEIGDLDRKLQGDERAKLEAHLASLRQTEASVAAVTPAAGGCSAPALAAIDPRSNDQFPAVVRAQIELMVAALACDLTRVASLQLSHTVSPLVPSWLGISEGHHALSHMDDGNAAGIAQWVQAERWFSEQLAHLLDRLQALPEPGAADGSSMLDHTLVVWSKEMGDSRAHDCLSVPFVLAGKAGRAIQPGRYLRFDHAPHTRLLTTICQAMGVRVDRFGDGGPEGAGVLEGVLS